jgi:plastocyanin/predicted phosphodiesterase
MFDALGELPDPIPCREEVVVAVEASSMNSADWKVRDVALNQTEGRMSEPKTNVRILIGSVVVAVLLGLTPQTGSAENKGKAKNFTFVQVSDTHWGFTDEKVNPDFAVVLPNTIKAINEMKPQPDFVVFTGDLTHTTDNPQERMKRLSEFRKIASGLKIKEVKFIPGEHDAALDNGKAYIEHFGKTHYVFYHKGITFIALDNVSEPGSVLGDQQLDWLKSELKKIGPSAKIVIFTHRPLFNLKEEWDWSTRDGAKAIELLSPYKNVVVFYGHIHQLNEHSDGNVVYHAARGLMYPLPTPGSVPKKAPIPWDRAEPYKNLGYRSVAVDVDKGAYSITEYPLFSEPHARAEATGQVAQVVKIAAKKFEYIPNKITIKKGVLTTLELSSLDVTHGFNCPGLHVRTNVPPGGVTRLTITPQKTGTFDCHCDVFCGNGHEEMTGKIVVVE